MEIYVGVACEADNNIPKAFGGKENFFFTRFEIDVEDGTVYGRQTVRCHDDNFVAMAEENMVKKFVYDTMPAEYEEGLKALGIELYPGRTGNYQQAALSVV